jgi:formyltetrahydrofolate deformylase
MWLALRDRETEIMTDAATRYTLTLSCADRVGIAAAVNMFLAEHQSAVLGASYYVDESHQRFFARQEIVPSPSFTLDAFRQRFAPIARAFQMEWTASEQRQKKRVVILVSKFGHCLHDLFERWQAGELPADIPCVISNHEAQREFVERHGVPFHHVPIDADNKQAAYEHIGRLFEDARGDVMVLARFMQVIPEPLCAAYPGRIINIHHSFLPSFAGARPYHQAHQRGVKLVGATSHYVTPALDQGPIIEQDVIRVSHADSADRLVQLGRDIEKSVLARSLLYHLEDRVLIHGNHTVVFR